MSRGSWLEQVKAWATRSSSGDAEAGVDEASDSPQWVRHRYVEARERERQQVEEGDLDAAERTAQEGDRLRDRYEELTGRQLDGRGEVITPITDSNWEARQELEDAGIPTDDLTREEVAEQAAEVRAVKEGVARAELNNLQREHVEEVLGIDTITGTSDDAVNEVIEANRDHFDADRFKRHENWETALDETIPTVDEDGEAGEEVRVIPEEDAERIRDPGPVTIPGHLQGKIKFLDADADADADAEGGDGDGRETSSPPAAGLSPSSGRSTPEVVPDADAEGGDGDGRETSSPPAAGSSASAGRSTPEVAPNTDDGSSRQAVIDAAVVDILDKTAQRETDPEWRDRYQAMADAAREGETDRLPGADQQQVDQLRREIQQNYDDGLVREGESGIEWGPVATPDVDDQGHDPDLGQLGGDRLPGAPPPGSTTGGTDPMDPRGIDLTSATPGEGRITRFGPDGNPGAAASSPPPVPGLGGAGGGGAAGGGSGVGDGRIPGGAGGGFDVQSPPPGASGIPAGGATGGSGGSGSAGGATGGSGGSGSSGSSSSDDDDSAGDGDGEGDGSGSDSASSSSTDTDDADDGGGGGEEEYMHVLDAEGWHYLPEEMDYAEGVSTSGDRIDGMREPPTNEQLDEAAAWAAWRAGNRTPIDPVREGAIESLNRGEPIVVDADLTNPGHGAAGGPTGPVEAPVVGPDPRHTDPVPGSTGPQEPGPWASDPFLDGFGQAPLGDPTNSGDKPVDDDGSTGSARDVAMVRPDQVDWANSGFGGGASDTPSSGGGMPPPPAMFAVEDPAPPPPDDDGLGEGDDPSEDMSSGTERADSRSAELRDHEVERTDPDDGAEDFLDA